MLMLITSGYAVLVGERCRFDYIFAYNWRIILITKQRKGDTNGNIN